MLPAVVPQSVIDPQSIEATKITQSQAKQPGPSRKWLPRVRAKPLLVFSSLLVAVTTAYTSYQNGRLIAINDQLAQSARIQADAAKVQADAAKAALEDARQSAIEIAQRAERMTRATEQNSKTATQALIVGLQAYIGTSASIVNFEPNDLIKINLGFLNVGNSPASITVSYKLAFTKQPIPPTNREGAVTTDAFTVLPGSERAVQIGSRKMSSEEIQALRDKKLFMFLYSVGGPYSTVGGKQPFKFCFMFRSETGGFAQCDDPKNMMRY